MFCTRLANGGLFPTGDHIVPFVISPRFGCLNKRTHTRTNPIPATEWECTSKCTSEKPDGISLQDLKNTEHTEILRSHPLSSTPTSRTTKSTHDTYQLMAHQMHQGVHLNFQAQNSCTGHRFLHQWYLATPTTDWRIFYIQSPQPNPDWGISYIRSQPPSLPLCLLTTDSVQWAHTPLLPLQGSQSQYHQFAACTLQRTNPPASSFAWSSSSLLKEEHLPKSGILLRTIRAYWSKRWVVTSSSFQN